VGTKVFVEHGWRACAGVSLGWMCVQLLVLLVRGPYCKRYTWFGYEGGWGMRPNGRIGMDAAKQEQVGEASVDTTTTVVDEERGEKQDEAAVCAVFSK
jgi:hypothetical protein